MSNKILLCCDLDRTVLPNGKQTESAHARALFRTVREHPDIVLAYVTGRDRALIHEAIAEYDIPIPDYALANVGTTIYQIQNNEWHKLTTWSEQLVKNWRDVNPLIKLLSSLPELTLQEANKQNRYKLSYYLPADIDTQALQQRIQQLLASEQINVNLVFSVDELNDIGLLDILPYIASKLHAIEFLAQHINFAFDNIVFAGDSGNDLPVLVSEFKAVIVNNALQQVKQQAVRIATEQNNQDHLYIARGDFLGLNGNYCSGVLEGLAYYFPQTLDWLQEAAQNLQ